MHLKRKRLLVLTIAAFVVALTERIVAVASVVGMYGCTTLRCYWHDGSPTKLAVFSTLNYLTGAVFLLLLILYLVYVISKKP
jgi:hypothetical protein